ncbi:DUF2259 domain-containing protein [Deinococcus psychrotolerans]|uniref:DUF2259 domain-containing protein n=1 Tax=Deinococcus psychrotolerans TaxID=2489213 RepID=A0A3G8YHM2_9DEIO|nr:DUF2259 domain-containing protein [Deinococcus psychrotolerans]AZI41974.1 DUF2259 domain-containing protein [Deinococcus psychrotolerans]
MMKCLLTLLLCALLGQAAADRAAPEFYGFSPDGRYAALAQHGIQEGSGFAYTELWVVDSAKNTLLERFYKQTEQGDGGGRAGLLNMQQVYAQAAPILNRLGISDLRRGSVIWKRTPPNLRPQPSGPDVFPAEIPGRPNMPPPQNYPLEVGGALWLFHLWQLPFGPSQACPPAGEFSGFSRGLKLTVTSRSKPNTEVTTTLQEDARVPTSRRCAFHYDLAEVRVQGNFMAVTVAMYRDSGFEATTDIRYLLVTGRRPDR